MTLTAYLTGSAIIAIFIAGALRNGKRADQLSDLLSDQLAHGEQPRLPSDYSFHVDGNTR